MRAHNAKSLIGSFTTRERGAEEDEPDSSDTFAYGENDAATPDSSDTLVIGGAAAAAEESGEAFSTEASGAAAGGTAASSVHLLESKIKQQTAPRSIRRRR